MNAYSGQLERVQLRLDLEPVLLGLSQAISCGLIVNELVTNALNYAFPGSRTGEVPVKLDGSQDGTVELRVADNGVDCQLDSTGNNHIPWGSGSWPCSRISFPGRSETMRASARALH